MSPILPYPNRWVTRAGRALTTRLQRHPLPMECHFNHSLVITWAFPPEVLAPYATDGLALDTYTDPTGQQHAFAAVALVDLDGLRVRGLPRAAGSAQLMAGYRVFMTLQTARGTTMRGLRILHSQATNPLAVLGANLTTRYHYRVVRATMEQREHDVLHARFVSADGAADVDVMAHLDDGTLPASTPFATERDARRFAGPLPYTFSPDPEGIVVVKSSRTDWHPQPVAVDVSAASFFDSGPFAGVPKRLANAFHVADLDYGWLAGRLHPVATSPSGEAR